jgi:hypothetical protein
MAPIFRVMGVAPAGGVGIHRDPRASCIVNRTIVALLARRHGERPDHDSKEDQP